MSTLLRSFSLAILSCLGLIAGVLVTTGPASADDATASGGVFVAVTPARIADTVNGINTTKAPIPAAGKRTIQVTGIAGIPSTGVGAVVLDVAASSDANTSVSAYTYGTSGSPAALRVNADGNASSNTMLVKPSSDGRITIGNAAGNTNVNVDVQGYFTSTADGTAAGGYVPVEPSRLVSTEDGIGVAKAQLVGGSTTQVQVNGVGDIPTNASAIFANVRVTYVTQDGGLKVQASNAPSNSATAINLAPGAPHDTGLTVKTGSDGKIKLILSGSSSMKVHVKIDVQGYFTSTAGQGTTYNPLPGGRIYDSRNSTAIPAKSSREVKVAGLGGIPDDARLNSVALTITALGWTDSGAVRVVNSDQPGIGTSNIGFWDTYNRPVSTTSLVGVSDAGTVRIDNTTDGTVHILLDSQGWFATPPQQWSDLVVDDPLQAPEIKYSPEPQLVNSSSDPSTVTMTPPIPTDWSMINSGETVSVRSATGVVGTYNPLAIDDAGLEVPVVLTSISGKLSATVDRPAEVAYPIAVMANFVPSEDQDADPSTGLLQAAQEDSGAVEDGATTPPDPQEGEVDAQNNVAAVPEGEVVEVFPTDGEAGTASTMSFRSSGSSSSKVKIPKNYKYHPNSGKRRTLHDYCTYVRDTVNKVTFRGPCARHDMCYEGIVFGSGRSKTSCNIQFRSDLRQNCRYAFGRFNPARIGCYRLAEYYAKAVVIWTWKDIFQ